MRRTVAAVVGAVLMAVTAVLGAPVAQAAAPATAPAVLAMLAAPAQQTGCSVTFNRTVPGGVLRTISCTDVRGTRTFTGAGSTADEALVEANNLVNLSYQRGLTCTTVANRTTTGGYLIVLSCGTNGNQITIGVGSTLTVAASEARTLLQVQLSSGRVCSTAEFATREVAGGYAVLIQCTAPNGFQYSTTGMGSTLTDAAQDARTLVNNEITANQRCSRFPSSAVTGGFRTSIDCVSNAGGPSYNLASYGTTLTEAAAEGYYLLSIVIAPVQEICTALSGVPAGDGYRITVSCRNRGGGERFVSGTGPTLTAATLATHG